MIRPKLALESRTARCHLPLASLFVACSGVSGSLGPLFQQDGRLCLHTHLHTRHGHGKAILSVLPTVDDAPPLSYVAVFVIDRPFIPFSEQNPSWRNAKHMTWIDSTDGRFHSPARSIKYPFDPSCNLSLQSFRFCSVVPGILSRSPFPSISISVQQCPF